MIIVNYIFEIIFIYLSCLLEGFLSAKKGKEGGVFRSQKPIEPDRFKQN